MKDLRKHRTARGQKLRYIYTTEEKHGEARLHHHLIINATGQDIEIIRSLWLYGNIIDVEQIDENDFAALAMYITKESVEGRPVGAQMWTGSKNLKRPEVETCFVPDDTTLTAPPGCHVLEKEEKVTEYGSCCYIKYRLPPPATPKRTQVERFVAKQARRRMAEAPAHIAVIAPIPAREGLAWGVPGTAQGARKRQHVSQRTLSQLCGLGKNAIARYESGERVPTLPVLLAIADYFGVTMDDLAGRPQTLGACDFGGLP